MAQTTPVPDAQLLDYEPDGGRVGRYRWVICALLFFATTVNYLDRQVLGLLAVDLQTSIGWTEFEYGVINGAFSLAYAIGLLVVGGLMDRWGTRRGFSDQRHALEFGRHEPRAGPQSWHRLCRRPLRAWA